MAINPITGQEESAPAPLIARKAVEKRVAVFEYDFAKQGGAIETFFLKGPTLPDNAVVSDCWIDVITVPDTGGEGTAAIALGLESTTDIQTSTSYGGAPYSTEGLADLAGPEPGTESGYIKLTAKRGLRMTIATARITAGRFFVTVEYTAATD
ncbi:hypothetical protein LCGC14_1377960 [marine sediment metagenome]|uniref:Uncharacterized protein n=1 Tax=marine sediment metagenome TaxID=412755 RepID=A0A0F9K3V4_9ZZZZ